MTVKDTKSSAYEKLLAATKRNAGLRLRVGVIGDGASKPHEGAEGLTVAEIAAKHELGLGVPERSFIRAWVDQNRARLDEEMRRVLARVFKGDITWEQAAPLLGARYAGEIQQFIADNKVKPPSTDRTNQLKGSTTTLIDSGQLRSAVTYIVEKKP